jgi:hypothetical protein
MDPKSLSWSLWSHQQLQTPPTRIVPPITTSVLHWPSNWQYPGKSFLRANVLVHRNIDAHNYTLPSQFATINACIYCTFMFLLGDLLVCLEQESMSIYETEVLHKQATTLLMMHCGLQFAHNLLDKNENPPKTAG